MTNQLLGLAQLSEFSQYLNDCPAKVKKMLVEHELTRVESTAHSYSRYPEIELRWLNFSLNCLEDEKNTYLYLKVMAKCRHLISDFIEQHQKQIDDAAQLKSLIVLQKQYIFSKCVSNALYAFLNQYQNQFTVAAVISDALSRYKEIIFHEELAYFETRCLIERSAQLRTKREYEKSSLVDGWHTITGEIDPELEFIDKKLERSDLGNFKLAKTKAIFLSLGITDKLSSDSIRSAINTFFQKFGDQHLDPEIYQIESPIGNKIKKRTTNLYLSQLNKKTLCEYLLDVHAELEQLTQSIQLPPADFTMQETKDSKLLQWRKNVLAWHEAVTELNRKEPIYYQGCHHLHDERMKALHTLSRALGRVDKLTEQTIVEAKALISTIKQLQPSWCQLKSAAKVMDILTLGVSAWHRFSIFMPENKQLTLEQLPDKLACEQI